MADLSGAVGKGIGRHVGMNIRMPVIFRLRNPVRRGWHSWVFIAHIASVGNDAWLDAQDGYLWWSVAREPVCAAYWSLVVGRPSF